MGFYTHNKGGALEVQERDSTNATVRETTWGLNLGGGIGGLLSLRQGGQDYSYVYDGWGNVSAVLDDAGAPVAAYGYDEFGVPVAAAGELDQPFCFSTKPYDPQTGLADFGYRFYSPAMGRWLSRDPLGEAADPLHNLYRFVGNNPLNNVDPDGLKFVWGASVSQQQREILIKSFDEVKITTAGLALFNLIQTSPTLVYVYPKRGGGRSGINKNDQRYLAFQPNEKPGLLAHEMQHTAEALYRRDDPAGLGVVSLLDDLNQGSQIPSENRAVRAQNIVNDQFYSNPQNTGGFYLGNSPITHYDNLWKVPEPYGTGCKK